VWTAQADHYFKAANYKLSAMYYGKTQKSFEEVALKFININEQDALKVYLLNKLESIKNTKSKVIILKWKYVKNQLGCYSNDHDMHMANRNLHG
jgi:hypothetical protein